MLLLRRPEAVELLAAGEPGWNRLASVLARPIHVAVAFDSLNLFLRQVVELAVFTGGSLGPAAAAAEGLDASHLRMAADELSRWGLAFRDSDGALSLLPELRRLIWDPGNLGLRAEPLLAAQTVDVLRPMAANMGLGGVLSPKRKAELVAAIVVRMSDPAVVGSLVGQAPQQARVAFDRLRSRGGQASTAGLSGARDDWSWRWHPERAEDGPWWLVGHGLALPLQPDQGQLAIPAEVEHALRGRLFTRWDPVGPALSTTSLPAVRHPLELVAAVTSLLQDLRAEPASALQQGGLPKRVIKRLAQRLNEDEEAVQQLVRLAFAAGLLTEIEVVPERLSRSRRSPRVLQSRQAVISVTARAEGWEASSEPERWVDLVRRVLLGSASDREWPVREHQTSGLLQFLAELPPDEGAPATSLAPCLHWRNPALFPSVSAVERDLMTLGAALAWLGAGGADPIIGLNAAGRLAAAAAGLDPDALHLAFPAAVDTCTVTADNRVVVAGPPSPALSRFLGRIAHPESVHPARVYKLDEASLRRGLDGGLPAAELRGGFSRHCPAGLPQNVAALVDDVIRRHGRLRVGPAAVYVVGEDPAEIEALAKGRVLRPLLVRRLAPTVVVVEAKSPDQVLGMLRKAGLMPVAETMGPEPSGPTSSIPPPSSLNHGGAPSPVGRRSEGPPRALDLAQALRLSPRLKGREPAEGAAEAHPVIEILQEAVRRRQAVAVGYQRVGGTTLSVVRLRPYSAGGGFLHGFDAGIGTIVSLDMRRVVWAEEIDEAAVSRAERLRSSPDGDDWGLEDEFLLEFADGEG
ncbi:MAG: helicase-associated domain-containing protein [Candidatus Dormibacteria bacterium]